MGSFGRARGMRSFGTRTEHGKIMKGVQHAGSRGSALCFYGRRIS